MLAKKIRKDSNELLHEAHINSDNLKAQIEVQTSSVAFACFLFF